MTILELKEMIASLPDEMEVVIPLNAGDGFDGMFFSPCVLESGEGELGVENLSDEDIAEMELLGKEIPSQDAFMLVPCGFFDEKHDEIIPELN